jgi:hypothetical protein
MFAKPAIWALLLTVAPIIIQAQDGFTRISGTDDRDVPTPVKAGVRGRKDAGALQEIVSFLQAVHFNGWTDMEGTGIATLPADSGEGQCSATLMILGSDDVRLDLQTAKGVRSIRLSGAMGETQHETGTRTSVPPSTAAIGLFAFSQLFTRNFSVNDLSVVDRGIIQIEGNALHRITLEVPYERKNADGSGHDRDLATDLYFDPASHLLIKSANLIRLGNSGAANLLRVVTYTDYREVNAMLIPFRYTQTLNGQRQWVLQLDQVQFNAGLNSSSFHF